MKKLFRNARSAEERKRLLRTLTSIDDDSAINVIEQDLGGQRSER